MLEGSCSRVFEICETETGSIAQREGETGWGGAGEWGMGRLFFGGGRMVSMIESKSIQFKDGIDDCCMEGW